MPLNSRRLRSNTEGQRGQSRSLNSVQQKNTQKKDGSNKNRKHQKRKRGDDGSGSTSTNSQLLVQQHNHQQHNNDIQGISPSPTDKASDLSDTDNTLFSSTAVLEDVLYTGSPLFSPSISSKSGLDVVAASENVVSLTAGVGGGYGSFPTRPKTSCLPRNDLENYCNGKPPTQSTPRKIYTNNSCLSQLSSCAIGGISAQLSGGKHRSRFADPSQLKQLGESFAEDKQDVSLDLVDLFKEEDKSPPIVGSLCREYNTDISFEDWQMCAAAGFLQPCEYSPTALIKAGGADEESVLKSIVYAYEQSEPNYIVNTNVIKRIKKMSPSSLTSERILELKNIAKVKTDKAIEKASAHWNRQPYSINKTRQMTYLQNLVASQYEAIDGMQAFGLPVVYGQLLCSTPECEGGVNASLYGTCLCKKKFEKCRSIKGILNFIHTFVEKGLCQKVNNKDIPILLGNVRACDRTEEFVNDCKANGKHWFCRKSDSLEQDTAGALLDAYFELAVALGNQTILLEAAGGKDGKAILQHVRRENISLELSSLYHIQFWANLVANITAICARIMIQLLNCSNAVADFCSVAGLDQSGVPSFAEIFCKRALPARYDIGTAVAKSILAKAGAHKIGKQEDVAAILETWFNANIADPYPPGEQKEDPVALIMSFIKQMRKGKKKRVATQKESIAILETWFNANIADPYPPGEQKEDPVALIMSFIKPMRKGKKPRSILEYSIGDKAFYRGSPNDAVNAFAALGFKTSYGIIRRRAGLGDALEPSLLGDLISIKEVIECINDIDMGFVGTNKEEVEASKNMIRHNLQRLDKAAKKPNSKPKKKRVATQKGQANDQNLLQQLQIQQQQKQLPQIQQQQLQLQQQKAMNMKTYMVKVPEGIGPNMPFDVSIEGQRMTITCPSNAQAGMTLSFPCKVTNEQRQKD